MARFFKTLVVIVLGAAVVQSCAFLKPSLVKVLKSTPISSKTLGPPKGLINAEEMVSQGEASFLFRSQERELFFEPVLIDMAGSIKHPSAYVIQVPQARVYSEKGVVISPRSDRLLDNSAFEFGNTPENCPVFSRLYLNSIKKLEGRCALLANPGHRVYRHWMFDILPRIALLQACKVEIDCYLVPELTLPYMKESLDFLGIGDKIQTLGFREHYAVEELIYPSLPCRFPTAYTPPWVYHWLREQFKPWTQLEKVYPKRILVSRLKASYRRMVNEEDLLKRLKPYGFELVYLEDLSLKDQIGLFSQIEMVVAPHGSGLTNLVFASEGTKVIEIFPPYQDCSVCYATMCQTLQLEYTPIRISQEYIRNRSDFLVDTSLIEGLVWSSLKDSGIPVELEYAVSMIP